jgi:hypothetical protein
MSLMSGHPGWASTYACITGAAGTLASDYQQCQYVQFSVVGFVTLISDGSPSFRYDMDNAVLPKVNSWTSSPNSLLVFYWKNLISVFSPLHSHHRGMNGPVFCVGKNLIHRKLF